jgi:hypothetical protein
MRLNQTPADMAIEPDELSMLQRVFDAVSEHRKLEDDRAREVDLASTLIELFQSGIRCEAKLLAALS